MVLFPTLNLAFDSYAYVASSTNYIIERDSINFAGTRSTSSNFLLEDTGGEVGTGRGTSTNYILNAGYQQSDGYISISAPSDVNLSPAINTLEGGTASGSTSWTVSTDNPTGYVLYVKASASPALQSGANSFSNYTPASSVPDYSWSVGSSVSEFGFTPEGIDIFSTYKDNGVSCGVGFSDTTSACWDSVTTSNKLIAKGSVSNHPSGTATTLRLQAQAGSSASQSAGSYSAGIIVTAIAI